MTRGTFILVTDKGVFESIEFNGCMYLNDGHGVDAINLLKNVNSKKDLKQKVSEFNKEKFGHEEDILVFEKKDFYDTKNSVDFDNEYFKRFFSDYLYIKNASTNEIFFSDDETRVEPGEIACYRFGTKVDIDEFLTDESQLSM